MTVTKAPTTNAAASARLAKAIAATTGSRDAAPNRRASAPSNVRRGTTPPTREAATTPTRGGTTPSTRDAARGANAAPDYTASGASAAGHGAQNVTSIAPGADGTSTGAYTPYQASSDAYTAPAQSVVPPGQDDAIGNQDIPEVRGTATTPIAGTGAWSPDWQRRFEKLQLAPADIAYLAQSGHDDEALFDIAMQLDQVETIDPSAPQPGYDAGSATSANGPLPTDSSWSAAWADRFSGLMKRMGMSQSEIDAQLKDVETQPISEAQLTEAYTQMEASLGDFDDAWKARFDRLLTALKTPAKDKAQVLEQLATSGLTQDKLQEAYTQMEASLPAWGNPMWESRFKALGVPDEMLTQLRKSGAPKAALEQQLKSLTDTKMKYQKDGRLDKLRDAKATPEEKWGVMTQGLTGKDFDKAVEQIHSSHVSGWKRVGSFAVNMIPGVFTVQYLTGKDWVTGEKIDRSNPLNIVGAVASGFAGGVVARGAVKGVQGLSAANAAFRAGTATEGLKGAVTAANLLPKFEKGLRFTDYLKSAVPLVNRFGEAGRLSSVGRGAYQSMQLAAGTSALKSVSGGGSAVDAATKAKVLGELKAGKSIEAALKTAGVTGSYADEAALAYKNYGFLQGSVGKAVDGARVMRGNGNFNFNPFKNRATISGTNNPNVMSLGRGVNFGTKGGLAQGIGAVRGAESGGRMAMNGAAQGAAYVAQAVDVNPLLRGGRTLTNATGLNMADDVQRIATMEETTFMAKELGVVGGSKFRSLFQIGGSNRNVARLAGVWDNAGSSAYRAGRHTIDRVRGFGGLVAPPIIGGAALGLTGRQIQPAWDYVKNRGEIKAQETEARRVADTEARELERLYQQQQAAGGAAPDAGTATTPADAAGSAAGAASTGASTDGGSAGQVFVDPTTGYYVDPTTGLMADPASGQVLDQSGQVVGNVNAQPAA